MNNLNNISSSQFAEIITLKDIEILSLKQENETLKQEIEILKKQNTNSLTPKMKKTKSTSSIKVKYDVFFIKQVVQNNNLYSVVVGKDKSGNHIKTLLSKLTEEDANIFKSICEEHFEDTGRIYRVKSGGRFKSIHNEELISESEAKQMIQNQKWCKDLKWVNGKLYLNGKDTGLNCNIINDIQSLKVSGFSLNGIYAEFNTRYPDLDVSAVRLIYENIQQSNFNAFYKKGCIK